MKKSRIAVGVLLLSAFLAGCNESEPIQTVDYYKANEAERKAMLEKCRNGVDGAITDNCVNATKAKTALETSRKSNSYTELEPLKPSDLQNLSR